MSTKHWATGCVALAAAIALALWWRARRPSESASASPGAATRAAAAQRDQGEGSDPDVARPLQNVPAALSVASGGAPAAPHPSPTVEARRAERARADALRHQFAERHPAPSRPEQATPEPHAEARPLSEAEQEHRRNYIQSAVRNQYFPVARSCYEELLGRHPDAKGTVVLQFSIVGDAEVDAGGVVDEVSLGDDSTMDDPEFLTCMRESMYSTVFEPPPRGSNRTTVEYPILLAPGP